MHILVGGGDAKVEGTFLCSIHLESQVILSRGGDFPLGSNLDYLMNVFAPDSSVLNKLLILFWSIKMAIYSLF